MTTEWESLDPILPGDAPSDYERYLRTQELLALQKSPDQMVHRDEMLFTTVHQVSELWLKHASYETEEATRLIKDTEHDRAARLLRRACHGVQLVTDALQMLEHLSPWDYQEIRRALGHGSGFDSPGFNRLKAAMPPLMDAFRKVLSESGFDLASLYQEGYEHPDLYHLAELCLELDERVAVWRYQHLKTIERIIGGHVVGTQGTPVEMLQKLARHSYAPDLWAVRDELTGLAGTSPPTPDRSDRR